METGLKIDVATLDDSHRRALEEVIRRELTAKQQVLINVIEIQASDSNRPAQSLDDWTQIYDGLSEEEIDTIDQVAKTRANLSRDLP